MVTIEGLGFSEIPANVMVSVAGKFIKEFSNLQKKKCIHHLKVAKRS